MMGWTCPVCGEANSPHMNTCVNGPHRRVITTTNTAQFYCPYCQRPLQEGKCRCRAWVEAAGTAIPTVRTKESQE